MVRRLFIIIPVLESSRLFLSTTRLFTTVSPDPGPRGPSVPVGADRRPQGGSRSLTSVEVVVLVSPNTISSGREAPDLKPWTDRSPTGHWGSWFGDCPKGPPVKCTQQCRVRTLNSHRVHGDDPHLDPECDPKEPTVRTGRRRQPWEGDII